MSEQYSSYLCQFCDQLGIPIYEILSRDFVDCIQIQHGNKFLIQDFLRVKNALKL